MAFYICNTSNIKEMELGRPQTVMFEGTELQPNGLIVELGDTMEATHGRAYDHIHLVEPLTDVDSFIGKSIVVAPEINYEQYRTIHGHIGRFALEPNETYTAYDLQKKDRFEYTEAYFEDAESLAVGDYLKLNANGKLEADANGGLRVVTILPTHLPIMMDVHKAGQDISLMPKSELKIKMEVVK